MLTEERWNSIVELVERNRAISVPELESELGVSASTIRRDLAQLHKMGRLVKVHGGATSVGTQFVAKDLSMEEKYFLNNDEKLAIANYAAQLIKPNDFVYIDAGTTTEMLVDCITEMRASYVTNSVLHARKLSLKGCHTYLPGGELKATTDALVGPMAIETLRKFHFTIGFWGTNGVSVESGFTTPEPNEAMIKQISMEQSKKRYVLCDVSKFAAVSPITFAQFESAVIITGKIQDKRYKKYENIVEVLK